MPDAVTVSPKKVSNQPKSILVYTALFGGLLIIGFSGVLIKAAKAPGSITVFYRVFIANLAVTIPLLISKKGTNLSLDSQSLRFAISGGVFFGLDLFFWSTGIVLSGATNPTLMANTAPLWVGLGAWLIFREQLSWKFWAGLFLALAGAIIVLGQDLLLSFEFGAGTFLGLLAAFFYGAYYLVTQRSREKINTLTYFWITTLFSSIALLIINIFMQNSFINYPFETIIIFLIIGLVVQLAGWLLINFVQGYLPASIVSPTLLGQPIITAIASWIVLGESFTMWHILGGFGVITGIYIIHRSR